jgi:small-conductance mechanosensitive channel
MPEKAIETISRLISPFFRTPASTLRRILILSTLVATLCLAQNAKKLEPANAPTQPAKPASQSASQPSPNNLPPLQLGGPEALHHLNQVISWYRHVTTGIQAVGLPTDAIYQDNTQSLGAQVVRLAFQSAKAESTLIGAQQKSDGGNQGAGQTTQQQNLAQLEAKTSTRIDSLNSQIDDLNAQISKTRGSKKDSLISQRDALAGELELQKALLDAIQKMMTFVETNGETAGGLEGSINQLAKTIPEVLGTATTSAKTATSPPAAKPTLATSGGLIADAMTVYDYMRAVHQIDQVIRETDYTREFADHMRNPLRTALRSTIQQSETMASQQPSGGDPDQLQAQKKQFEELTERFKQLAAAMLPLSQEVIVLNDAKANFAAWRASIARESKYVLRSVLLRVLGILIALGIILFISELWRRITFRYIGDARRRRQFLLIRRIVVGVLVVLVLVFGFVSEFSSLATFAGFITAGVAVALQAVVLSVAAYFFIIGRYGIRVGDRISVAGVTGDVVDVGLVRMYLVELAGTGVDFYPTGRIVVLSNSVLFQTATPLFKQIPGTEYSWHEVVIMIAPDGNHKEAEAKLVAAVNSVYAKYQHEIERQHASIERRIDIQVRAPRPEARLQFANEGLELLVRYPVEIRKAPDIDEQMTRTVLDLVQKDPELKAAVSGTPKIRSAIKG